MNNIVLLEKCPVVGCDRPIRIKGCLGYCSTHENAMRKYGTPTPIKICQNDYCGRTYVYFDSTKNSTRFCPECYVIFKAHTDTLSKIGRQSFRQDNCRKYNMTVFDYAEIIKFQNGKCALLGCINRKLHVDHDHKCCPGQYSCGTCIRGLLCNNCNSMLGHYEKGNGIIKVDIFEEYLSISLNEKMIGSLI